MLENWQMGLQFEFLIDIIFALVTKFVIGLERESRGKPAGISTNSLAIGGAMPHNSRDNLITEEIEY